MLAAHDKRNIAAAEDWKAIDADSDEPAFQAGVNRLEALQELMLRALAVWLIFAALWAVLPT